MKEPEKLRYQDVMELGFTRTEHEDKQFYNANGYEWFIVRKKLTKRIYLEWDCETHIVTLYRYDKEGTILGALEMYDLEEVKDFIEFFNDNPWKK